MMENRTFRLRVTYGKSGRLAYLSHLEITHALERMVRRSELPFALSEGFSPHMKIAFGSALGVGVGSTCEIFDLTLSDYIAPAKALAKLQAAAPELLMPFEAKYVDARAKAASVAYPYSVYEAVFDGGIDPDEIDWPEEITVIRKKKEKVLKVADFLVGEPTVKFSVEKRVDECGDSVLDGDSVLERGLVETLYPTTRITFQLHSGDNGNLRPDVLVEHLGLGVPLTLTRVWQGEKVQ